MKIKIISYAKKVIIFFTLTLPFYVYALGGSGGTGGVTLNNPLKGINNLQDLVVRILDAVVKVGAYVAVASIIYSGFLFVKAQGSEKELEDAKRIFFYTIIGIMILLGAKAIALAIGATITSITTP